MIRKMLVSALAALGLAAIPGCGTDGPVGHVRLVNATSDASLDLYDSNTSVVTGVASEGASAYADVQNGTRTLNIESGDTGLVLASASAFISTDKHYTMVAYTSGGTLQTAVLSEDEPAPASGRAELRVLNAASTEVGSVDIYLTTNDCSALSSQDGTIATSLSGLQAAFQAFNAGTFNLCVTTAGSKSDVRMSANQVVFASGQVATLVLTPTTGGVLLDGLMLPQQGSPQPFANQLARVRLVADAANASDVVSAALGTTSLGAGYSRNINSYVALTAGTFTPTVTIGGTSVTVASQSITAGSDYTLLVAGTADNPTVALFTDDNKPSTDTTLTTKIRLVNGVNGADGQLGSLAIGGTSQIGSVSFGTASSEVLVTPGSSLSITGAVGSTVVYSTTSSDTLVAGTNYTLFLMGSVTDGSQVGYLHPDN